MAATPRRVSAQPVGAGPRETSIDGGVSEAVTSGSPSTKDDDDWAVNKVTTSNVRIRR
jgi:hypothetical protein